jgi:hypothetical protein
VRWTELATLVRRVRILSLTFALNGISLTAISVLQGQRRTSVISIEVLSWTGLRLTDRYAKRIMRPLPDDLPRVQPREKVLPRQDVDSVVRAAWRRDG